MEKTCDARDRQIWQPLHDASGAQDLTQFGLWYRMKYQHKVNGGQAMEQNKIRFVTANYHQLQGLRLVPLGLFLAFWALLELQGPLTTPPEPDSGTQ